MAFTQIIQKANWNSWKNIQTALLMPSSSKALLSNETRDKAVFKDPEGRSMNKCIDLVQHINQPTSYMPYPMITIFVIALHDLLIISTVYALLRTQVRAQY